MRALDPSLGSRPSTRVLRVRERAESPYVDGATVPEDATGPEDATVPEDATGPKLASEPFDGAAGGATALPTEDDAVSELGEEIMTLSARIAGDMHRLLRLIAEFDRRRGWERYGYASCAEWLAHATRLDKVTARERVRVARALVGLPATSAAMARGELSFSQVRAITRVADEASELELLEHARSTSAAGLERLVRSWRRLGREDEAKQEARRHASRCLSVFADDDGMYVVRGKLEPEVGALLLRAIECASEALYRGGVPGTTPEQRRADALALLAETALAVGFQAPAGVDDSDDSAETRAADDSAETPADPGAAARPVASAASPHRSERYLVVLHVDEATLDPQEEPGRSELEDDATRVSAESARRFACDASVVRVGHGRDGSVKHVGDRVRRVPLRLRRALEVRDRGCRFPGCGSRYTDAHHIRHWADGGPTRLDNLILLCRTHHRLLHEGGFRLEPDPARPGEPAFYSPRGVRIPEVPPRILLDGRPLARRDEAPGAAEPREPSGPPRWESDVPLALYLGALHALR